MVPRLWFRAFVALSVLTSNVLAALVASDVTLAGMMIKGDARPWGKHDCEKNDGKCPSFECDPCVPGCIEVQNQKWDIWEACCGVAAVWRYGKYGTVRKVDVMLTQVCRGWWPEGSGPLYLDHKYFSSIYRGQRNRNVLGEVPILGSMISAFSLVLSAIDTEGQEKRSAKLGRINRDDGEWYERTYSKRHMAKAYLKLSRTPEDPESIRDACERADKLLAVVEGADVASSLAAVAIEVAGEAVPGVSTFKALVFWWFAKSHEDRYEELKNVKGEGDQAAMADNLEVEVVQLGYCPPAVQQKKVLQRSSKLTEPDPGTW